MHNVCIYICKSLQLHLFVSGSFLYFLGVGWNQCPLQLLSLLTEPEQNCQHVIFFNLSPLRSNEISQHPSAITVVHFCLALIVPPSPIPLVSVFLYFSRLEPSEVLIVTCSPSSRVCGLCVERQFETKSQQKK